MTLVIVVPAYNEAEALAGVVAGAGRHAPVIVVDDGSSDGSADEARRAGAEVIRHPRRRGKAAALRTGFAAARAGGAEAVVTLDGDGQHDPGDVPLLARAARETPDRLIVGNRLVDTARFDPARLNAMEVAAFFVEWVSDLGMRDTQSGFRVYPVALLDDVGACRGGFVFETEVLIAAARRGWRVREVAVSSIPSARRRSRFRPVRDGVAIGAYLTNQSLRRWGRELTGAGPSRLETAWLAGPRLESTWPAGRTVESTWLAAPAAARRRRGRVALATAATPVLLGAAVAQAGLGWLGVDLVTPLVRRVYARDRLASAPPAAVRLAAAEAESPFAAPRTSPP